MRAYAGTVKRKVRDREVKERWQVSGIKQNAYDKLCDKITVQ